jgi:hypothetical protein
MSTPVSGLAQPRSISLSVDRRRVASAWTQAIVVGALAVSILALVIGVGAASA